MKFVRVFSLRHAALVALISTVLGACSSAPDPVPVPTDVVFTNTVALNVDATSLDVQIENTPPKEYPYVGHRSPVTFERAVQKWVDTRFTLTGNTASAFRVTLKKGEIVEELLPVERGISGTFKKEQAAKFEARLEVVVELIGPNGEVLATANGEARNSHTVPEDATENDKRIVWIGMVEQAFNSLDQELGPRIHQGMGEYIR